LGADVTGAVTKSMTGFAAGRGAADGYSWGWDIRSVNARGFDARLRLPDWIDGLEAALRPMIAKTVARGNVNLTLRVTREDRVLGISVDPEILNSVLSSIQGIEDAAKSEHNLRLAPTSAAEILGLRALSDISSAQPETGPLLKALSADLAGLLTEFDAMRVGEGQALAQLLAAQIDQIEVLTAQAGEIALDRQQASAANLRRNLARVLENSDGADGDRVAQELAIIAVKADVTEEIDRLNAHVAAARELLAGDGPKGRKLDFLTQEFVREANTLCSKAQFNALTLVGLDLKAVIEQMREQVQNVE